MRHLCFLAALLLLTAPLAAQDTLPSTQPAERKVIPFTNRAPLTYQQAIANLKVSDDKKAAAIAAFEKRDAQIDAWYQQNKQELADAHQQAKSAREAKDDAALALAEKRLATLDAGQEAIRNALRKTLSQLFTPNDVKAIDYAMRTSPPPLDGSKLKSLTLMPLKPEFTPRLTADAHAALLEMSRPLNTPGATLADRQNAIEAGLKKTLAIFSDDEQQDLIGRIVGAVSAINPNTLELTPEQVTQITAVLGAMLPDPAPDAAETEKKLRQVFAVMNAQQKEMLIHVAARGKPYTNYQDPPLRPVQAVEVLSLAPEQKAQVLKIIDDFDILWKIELQRVTAQSQRVHADLLQAAKNQDRNARDALVKQQLKMEEGYRTFRRVHLNDPLGEVLTASDHRRFVTLITFSPSPDAAPSTNVPLPTVTQALETLGVSEEKKAGMRKAMDARREKQIAFNKDRWPELKDLYAKLRGAWMVNDTKTARALSIRIFELQGQQDAIKDEFEAARTAILSPEEIQKLTQLTTRPQAQETRVTHITSIVIQPTRPAFPPERVREIYSLLPLVMVDPPQGKDFALDQEIVIRHNLIKVFRLFPDGEQLELLRPSGSFDVSIFLKFTPDQVTAIRQAVSVMKSSPDGVSAAAAAQQALGKIIDTLTSAQKHQLFFDSFNGNYKDIASMPGPWPDAPINPVPANAAPLTPLAALDALNPKLTDDVRARAAKLIQDHQAALKQSDTQFDPLYKSLLKARRADDFAAVSEAEKQLAPLRQKRTQATLEFNANLQETLTPPIYTQYRALIGEVDPSASRRPKPAIQPATQPAVN
jgi:hypothetical protein